MMMMKGWEKSLKSIQETQFLILTSNRVERETQESRIVILRFFI
jgi:hypothetical protein